MQKKGSLSKLKKQENRMGYIFAFPWMFGLIVFGAFPIIASLYISFTSYDMISAPRFIGIENYKILLFNDNIFYQSLGNTIYHVALAVPLGMFVGVVLALLDRKSTRLNSSHVRISYAV